MPHPQRGDGRPIEVVEVLVRLPNFAANSNPQSVVRARG